MSQTGKLGTRVLLGIPTTHDARRSVRWSDAMWSLAMPLGSSMGRLWIEDETIANARNALCEAALAENVDYLVMIGDDVLPPPNALLLMLDKIDRWHPIGNGREAIAQMITGVYWTKGYPTEPYLWRGMLKGSYRDWKAGEFIQVDLAGCDCLIIPTAVLRKIPKPWFSTDWVWEETQEKPSPIATEDFYFFLKARLYDVALFADTSIQCLHEDRNTGQMFGLTTEMPQAGGTPLFGQDELLIADLGSGTDTPYFGEHTKVVRFDARDEVSPDWRVDLHALPEAQFGLYDVVFTSHTLEHFGRSEAPALVQHWSQLLKVNGSLMVRVPNVGYVAQAIVEAEAEARTGVPKTDIWELLYGGQRYPLDFHKNGFTARKLRALLEHVPGLGHVSVNPSDNGRELLATARKLEEPKPESIGEWWRKIEERAAHREQDIGEDQQQVIEALAEPPHENGLERPPPEPSRRPAVGTVDPANLPRIEAVLAAVAGDGKE